MNDKAKKTVEAAISQLGNPYVFGAWGSECTPSLRRKYAGYNPEHRDNIFRACPVLNGKAEDCGGCKWSGKLAFDCRGFTHWVLEQVGIRISGGGATSQYNTASNWAQRGTIDSMPDLPCCVFKADGSKMQHTGYHIGGGRIIHCSAGVQEGNASDKGWTHYGVPAGLYGASDLASAAKLDIQPTLRKGSSGEAVRRLQLSLQAMGYYDGEVDGVYGKMTASAVWEFQHDHNSLTVDGICGPATWAAINQAQEGAQEGTDKPTDNPPQPTRDELVEQMRACYGRIQQELARMAVLIEAVNGALESSAEGGDSVG